jgi:hypothetical protein
MSVTKEGCIEVLDCTSMRRHPGEDHSQKEPTSETSSVSRCIKEEDEIDYPTATTGTVLAPALLKLVNRTCKDE